MSVEASFEDLLNRLRAGEEQAAQQIFQRFACRLIGLARGHLDGAVRRKVDAEDIMQSALKSFFVRHADGQYNLGNWDALWSLLAVITLRKCGYHTRHFRAAGRDVHREGSLPRGEDDSSASFAALSRDPSPSEAAKLAETVEVLLRELEERDRSILVLSLQGYTAVEISTEIGRAERTVYRVLERIRERLQQMRREDEGS